MIYFRVIFNLYFLLVIDVKYKASREMEKEERKMKKLKRERKGKRKIDTLLREKSKFCCFLSSNENYLLYGVIICDGEVT